ncbi:MAG: ABC transporter ATP-binding protein [Acetatifactor sp.]|nr:ABC transporter ATP-binding protein [Acetatifactor sp.]
MEQKHICLEGLQRHIAYVDQQVYLFQDTIRFNITLEQSFTDREIMAVIKRCRLEDFVNSLPDGLGTVIKENGKNLSGGQRQRIALARGLIEEITWIVGNLEVICRHGFIVV